MDAEKKQEQSAQPTSDIDNLVKQIKHTINKLVAEECEPKPPGCDGTLGSGTYEGLAQKVQDANSSRKTLISDIKKDFYDLASMINP